MKKKPSVDDTIAALLKKARKKLNEAEVASLTQAFYEAGTNAVLAKVGTAQDAAKALNFAREMSGEARLQMARNPAKRLPAKPYQGADWQRLDDILAEHRAELLQRPGVVGIGLGHRRRDGIRQPEKTVTVYVEQKVPLDKMGNRLALPTTLRGADGTTVNVDVMQFGKFKRSAAGGSSIGTGTTWGTLGVLGLDIATGSPVAFTAGHVMENNAFGDDVYAPWPQTDESVLLGNYLNGTMQEIDAAVIELAAPDSFPNIIPGIGTVNSSRSVADSDRGKTVRMYGAKSHYQIGEIYDVHIAMPGHHLIDTIVVHITADEGDSGAAILDYNNIVLGLLVGQGEGSNLHVFTPIDAVLSILECRIP